MSTSDLIFGLIEWIGADSPESFDPSFIESIRDYYKTHDRITDRQRNALDNIVEKFDIDVESYL